MALANGFFPRWAGFFFLEALTCRTRLFVCDRLWTKGMKLNSYRNVCIVRVRPPHMCGMCGALDFMKRVLRAADTVGPLSL